MVEKSGERVRQMFAQIAPNYDRMNHLLSLNIDKRWRNFTVRRLLPRINGTLLDVCTGTGDLALTFAQQSDCPEIVASDFCAPMLDIARSKQTKQHISSDRLRFIEADAQSLPFEDNRFSVVTVAFGLRNVSDTARGLREMLRVCKPRGTVAVLEFSKPHAPGLKQLYSFYFRRVLPRIGQSLARNQSSAYQYLPASVSEFPCGQDLIELMEQCGYVDTELHPLTLGVATLYMGRKP